MLLDRAATLWIRYFTWTWDCKWIYAPFQINASSYKSWNNWCKIETKGKGKADAHFKDKFHDRWITSHGWYDRNVREKQKDETGKWLNPGTVLSYNPATGIETVPSASVHHTNDDSEDLGHAIQDDFLPRLFDKSKMRFSPQRYFVAQPSVFLRLIPDIHLLRYRMRITYSIATKTCR